MLTLPYKEIQLTGGNIGSNGTGYLKKCERFVGMESYSVMVARVGLCNEHSKTT